MWNNLVGAALLPVLLSGCLGTSSDIYRSDTVISSDTKNGDSEYSYRENKAGETDARAKTHPLPIRNRHDGAHHGANPSVKDMTAHHTPRPTKVIDPKALPELGEIMPRLAEKRVIFVGETHTRLADHSNQLAIIRGLFERGKKLAIGMEFFQQPFQAHLDDFIAGNIDDAKLLDRTEYHERWRYDSRLYQPILDFARERKIPLIALNVSSEIVKKVSEKGWDALAEDDTLTTEERAQIPRMLDRSNEEYEKRLRGVFRQHADIFSETTRPGRSPSGGREENRAGKGTTGFRRFMDVQLLWDEGMAARAAKYVAEHPARTLIVLAGSGHLAYGHGIPDRFKKRIPVDTAIVLPADSVDLDPAAADFLLVSQEEFLPRQGILGIALETAAEGMRVASFLEESAAKAAGIEIRDCIRFIDKRPIEAIADIRLALRNKGPGDRVCVEARRTGWFTEENLRFEVELR
uniref:Uncharacterized iron-regulated protein n=1 Tax=Candidatus Kentrum sp. UNK TaxID=2126344 RepID=A0A451ANI5_9GAMM|nr:MAG: Uncharacterized iron-regulated protein [Candidatus Kentron sp. UNK]VFK72846.1 MAG: Uncharacterized iron-regulated protein [Candidatus Kentron sp. UNK]